MKQLLSIILLCILSLTFTVSSPALAGNLAKGAEIFAANCAVCHRGGKNAIIAYKTLKKDALAKYLKDFNKDAEAAVAHQIINGKNAMPSFKGRLNREQIDAVAAYVVQQAEKGW